ncbi:MAG: HD domain-containing phosphohydrolase [Candidatus Brocadiales bacterium]
MREHTILVVDDEKYIVSSIRRSLVDEGYNVLTATSAAEGLEIMQEEEISLVISDYRMPTMNGIEFLQKVKNDWYDTVRILLTAYSDIGIAVQAINRGEVYRFISKPWKGDELNAVVSKAVASYNLIRENKRLTELTKQQNEQLKYWSQNLEKKVAEQANRIRSIFLSAIESLVSALEAKDKYTEGHSLRAARVATSVARKLSLPDSDIERIRIAGLLHDVGKIGIKESLLQKNGKLTYSEMNHIRTHSIISEHILRPIIEDTEVVRIIRHHHEHYNGIGYPDGIKGEKIPIGARILSVVDAFDAITTDRPYVNARPLGKAIEEIKRCTGTQFDPTVVDAFLKTINGEGQGKVGDG